MYICIYNCIWLQIATLPLTSSKEIIPYTQLPGLMSVMMLESVVGTVQVSLDETFTKAMVKILHVLSSPFL